MSLLHREDRAHEVPASVDPSENTCNHNYVLGAANTNGCAAGLVHIVHPDDCENAAKRLGPKFKAAPAHNFTISNALEDPLKWPANCFAHNGLVYYNPYDQSPPTYVGSPVCERELYPMASTVGACPTDFEVISDFDGCTAAFECVLGNAGCKMKDFQTGAIVISQVKPKGCYREPVTGCFNFNHIAAEPTGAIVTGTRKMCKLTTPPVAR